MLKSGLFLGGSNAGIALLGLARNILIARLISVEDFGIASTFAITMALVEMTSNIAIDRLLVQAPDGNAPALQATAQSLQVGRGAIGTALVFLIAEPLAALFGIRHAAWAYQLLALVPLLRGLAHLDMFRLQREMRFAPSIKVEFTAIAGSTLGAIPLALHLGDFRVMLYSILLQQGLFTLVSHLVAERPYRWAWDGDIARRAIHFGWPLLLNGLLMFGTFHGDRIIVGSLIGMTELGWFSAASTLTLAPTLVFAKTLSTFFLPQLSNVQDDPAEFHRLYLVTVQAALLTGVLLAFFFAIAGSALTLLYGPRYEPAIPLLVWLAVMQGIRIAKAGPAIVALSKAETKNPMIANLVRILVLPVAWVAVYGGAGITTVVSLAIAGEILGFGVSIYLLQRQLSVSLTALTIPFFACVISILCILVRDYEFYIRSSNYQLEHLSLLVSAVLVVWSMRDLRAWLGAPSHRT